MDFKKQAPNLLEKHLTEWKNHPERMKSGYAYEATYAEMVQRFEKELS